MRVLVAIAAALASVAGVVYGNFTTEIPAQSMLVATRGGDVPEIIAVFPRQVRLPAWDARLAHADVLPYWRWDFGVARDIEKFQYGVTLSIMGSPEEALKYHGQGRTHWRRQQLQDWASTMLHRFEADTWEQWSGYRKPPTEPQEEAFRKMLLSWFEASRFANQGIRVEKVVVNLPRIALEPDQLPF